MEKLYNNIILPDDFDKDMSYPNNVPYLKNPPDVINVTVGRQLFVDDFLIEETDLKTEYHKAKKFEGNPVLFPETKLETETGSPVACPKSGGVWYDEEEKKYKMWYEAGWLHYLAYAESDDGINWVRPELDLVPGTNQILPFDPKVSFEDSPLEALQPDSCTFFIDYDAPKEERYKMAHHGPRWAAGGVNGTSADGIHWKIHGITGPGGDRCSAFYNPFRKKWVFSIRSDFTNKDPYFYETRTRDYFESDSFTEGIEWKFEERKRWLAADIEDTPDAYIINSTALKGFSDVETDKNAMPGLYCVDAIGYESIMLGMFEIHRGLSNNDFGDRGVPKITELIPMYSRDGYNFLRPNREPLIWASRYKGSWDRGYVQSVGGGCIIHGDELWIYYSGFSGDESKARNLTGKNAQEFDDFFTGMYCGGATGIAIIRRDGFVSMNGKGTLLTRKLEFTGKKTMGINAIGKVKAEILDENGNLLATSREFDGDSTNYTLNFGDFDIESLNGKIIKIKFTVDGKLFAFGFADKNGDYGGAHAAGIADI